MKESKAGGRIKETVLSFFKTSRNFKDAQSNFQNVKADFNKIMESLYQSGKIGDKVSFEFGEGSDIPSTLTVSRIQKANVVFDADKLESALGKRLSVGVILKSYTIVDMPGMISYLKEIGADPTIFKSFISVEKSVDTKALDRLYDVGKVDEDQIKGCFTIKPQNPYFIVKAGKGQNDEQNFG